jgi:hypothetical protein
VRGQPWLTMAVTEGDRGAHIAVLLEGPATVVPVAQAPDDIRAAVAGAWVSSWIRLEATRVLSYAAPGALPDS